MSRDKPAGATGCVLAGGLLMFFGSLFIIIALVGSLWDSSLGLLGVVGLGLFTVGFLLVVVHNCRRLLLGIGLVLLALSGYLFFNAHSFVSKAAMADGIIVALNSDERNSDRMVSFQTEGGQTLRFPYGSGSVGDKVTVLYDPEHPSEARINLWKDLWGWSLVTIVFGAVSLLLSFGACVAYRRSRARRQYFGYDEPGEDISEV